MSARARHVTLVEWFPRLLRFGLLKLHLCVPALMHCSTCLNAQNGCSDNTNHQLASQSRSLCNNHFSHTVYTSSTHNSLMSKLRLDLTDREMQMRAETKQQVNKYC